jgi:NAD-dependent SIR2 family protein deacetylase
VKTVFILGAGASLACGAPLMRDFIARAKKLQESNAFGASSDDTQNVLNAAYRDLRKVQAKSAIDYLNIEELFSAIDMGAMLGVFGSRDPSTLNDLRRAVRVFIYRTLEETVQIERLGKTISAPKGYDALAKMTLEKMKQTFRLGKRDVAFITFNYDACLEFALVKNGMGVDYGLREPFLDADERRYQVTVPVLKLHGSINWARCTKCNSIVPTEVDPWRRAHFIDIMDQPDHLKLSLGSRISGKQHSCGSALDSVPLLVPPTWNKAADSGDLGEVWKRAAQELASADNVVVIGYSFPVTDTFFRYLFALGSDSDVHLETFMVINGERGHETVPRFAALLGPMSQNALIHHDFVFAGASAEGVIRQVLEA